MKNKKRVLIPLFIAGLLAVTGCSLFNDDDMKLQNSYSPTIFTSEIDPDALVAGGVVSVVAPGAPTSYCFKDIPYGVNEKVSNTYKPGGVNEIEYPVNGGEDYPSNTANNNYDLYVPKDLDKKANNKVILFIHGGSWVSGFKTDVNEYVYEFANRGYITATIKYTLLKRSMNDNTLSIFRNLDEIDACIKSIKNVLGEIDVDTSKLKLIIGGASSGSHLAMLYSYSRGQNSPIPLKFIVNAVGPVDMKTPNWKAFNNVTDAVLDAGLGYTAIEAQRSAGNLVKFKLAGEDEKYWSDYQILRVANGMCGIPFTLEQVRAATDAGEEDIVDPTNAAYKSMTKPGGGEDLLSVTNYIGANKFPIISAYGGMDTIVGIAQYAKLEKALNDQSVAHEYFYFRNSDHSEITREKDQVTYDAFLAKIDEWGKAA